MAQPWKISSIAEALPGFDHETIREMLMQCRGDIDNAFARLLDGDNDSDLRDGSSSSPVNGNPASSVPDTLQSGRPARASASFKPSAKATRSSSTHSTASKRSPSSDDEDEEGEIRSANSRRRGRAVKRRILPDVTVGIRVPGKDDNDVISICLRVDGDTDAEQADGAPDNHTAHSPLTGHSETELSKAAPSAIAADEQSSEGNTDPSDSTFADLPSSSQEST
jgi:hypothetical protein